MFSKNQLFSTLQLKLSFRRTVPVMLQTESAECGLACLTMIASYYGKESNILALRQSYGISSRGATLETLASIASGLKLGFRALSLEMGEINKLNLPCIIHWDFNHFVVLVKVTGDKIIIHDPAVGKRVISYSVFSKHFTGVGLELWPETGFVQEKNKKLITTKELINKIIGFKSALTKIFFISLVIETIAMFIPVGTQLVMDHVIPAMDIGLLGLICIGLFILTLMQTFLVLWRSWSIIVIDVATEMQWKDSFFHHLLKLPLLWFEKRRIGDIQSRFQSLDDLRLSFIHDITGGMINCIIILGTFFMLVLYGGSLSIVVISFSFLYVLIRLAVFPTYRQLSEESIIKNANASSYLTETLYGISTVRAQGLSDNRRKRWMTLMMTAFNSSVNVNKFDMLFQLTSSFISACDSLVILWIGIKLVMEREMTIGAFVAFGIFRIIFSDRLLSLTDTFLNLKMQSLHNERISDIALTLPEAETCEPHVLRKGQAIDIIVKGLSFRYDKTSPYIIDNLSLAISAGESVAITGSSGCGKSTLMRLMAGLVLPDKGNILASGKNIYASGINSYRKRIACILQDDKLLSGSLRDNITGFSESVDEILLLQCTTISYIHDDIMSLPMGYDTFVGELGEGLSGGQRQRIFIARALYSQPGILFMDEATSHLDERNEKLINDAVSGLDMTRVIIAHRPSTIASADRIICLDKLEQEPV